MKNVFWTPLAESSYQESLDFIFDQWSLDIALQWDAKVSNLLNKISEHKNLCPPSKKFIGLRRCAITEYTSLLYRVKGDTVELITFFDNRSKHPF